MLPQVQDVNQYSNKMSISTISKFQSVWLQNASFNLDRYKMSTSTVTKCLSVQLQNVNQYGNKMRASMKKVNKQCLLDTPRTVRVSEKNLVLASDSSNQQTLVLKKKISVESVKTRFK